MTFLSTKKTKLFLTVIAALFLLFLTVILPKQNHFEKTITLKEPSFQQVIDTIKPDVPISIPDKSLVVKSKKVLTSVLIESFDTSVKIDKTESIAKVYKIHPENNNNLDAAITLTYNEEDLNGLLEDHLILYSSTDKGKTWQPHPNSVVDPVSNSIHLDGIEHFSLWTAGLKKTINPTSNNKNEKSQSTFATASSTVFSVKDIQIDEDGNDITDGDTDPSNDPELLGITLDPSLRVGGQFANVVDTEVKYGDLRTAQTFTIPAGTNPSAVRMTVLASDSDNDVLNLHSGNNNYDQDHLQVFLNIDLVNNTYSGIVQDFSQVNLGKFVFAEQALGSDASDATIIEGDTTGVTRDLNISYDSAAGIITVIFKDDDNPEIADAQLPYERGGADQGAYLAEFLDATNSSLDLITPDPIVGALVDQNQSEARFSLAGDPDLVTLTAALGDKRFGNKAQDEPRGAIRFVLQKQSDNTYLANGAITFTGIDQVNSNNVTTYAVEDYVVGMSAGAFLSDPIFSQGDVNGAALDKYDAQIYIDNTTNELVVLEATGFSGRISMYNAERYKFAKDTNGNDIGSSGQYLGTVIGEGDISINTNNGADFTFDIPAGSLFGTINFAGQNGVHENGGMVSIRIALERDSVTGEIIGGFSGGTTIAQRNKNPTFISWSGIDLTEDIQLLEIGGTSSTVPGVLSNLYNLTGHDDRQWGGMTISLDTLGGNDVIRVKTIKGSASHGNITLSGVGSEWFGVPAVVMKNLPEGISFAYGTQIDATTWSFAIPEVNSTNTVNFSGVSDNFNGAFNIDAFITSDPTIVETHSLNIISNGDLTSMDEGQQLSAIASTDTNPPGDSISAILGTSSQSPTKNTNGIAITDTTIIGTGYWEYSIDNGTTWNTIGAVSETNALLLENDDLLRFLGDGTALGEPTITFKAWDQSGDALAGGDTGINTTSAFSTFPGASSTLFSEVPDIASIQVLLDTDGDRVFDIVDIDDDNDGILDAEECSINLTDFTPLVTAGGLSPGDQSVMMTTNINGKTLPSTLTIDAPVIVSGGASEIKLTGEVFNGNNQLIMFVDPFTAPGENFSTNLNISPASAMRISASNTTGASRINSQDQFTFTAVNAPAGFSWNVLSSNLSDITNDGNSITILGTGAAGSTNFSEFEIVPNMPIEKIEVNYQTASGTGLNSGVFSFSFCPDTDGDGIVNQLDLDSDGDGCYDSFEAGTLGATNDGSATDSLAIVTTDTTGVGANGFANALEMNEDGTYTGIYHYAIAVDSLKNECQDNDGDSVPDYADIDDDNDGVLDVEDGCTLGFAEIDNGGGSANLAGSSSISGTLPNGVTFTGTENSGLMNFATPNSTNTSCVFSSSTFKNGETNTDEFSAVTKSGVSIATFDFSETVSDLILHINGLDRRKLEITGSGVTSIELLSGNAQTEVVGNVIRDISPGTVHTPNCSAQNKSVQGTFLIKGFFSSLDFTFSNNGSSTDDGMRLNFGCAKIDTDGDGLFDQFDLDSDGDGCYDSYEAGVIGATNDGSATDSLAIVTSDTTGVGTNGFVNNLETTTEGEYDGIYTYSIAIDSTQNQCLDTDMDGVPDYVDIDDDNDGILDVEEQLFFGIDALGGTLPDGTTYSISSPNLSDNGNGEIQVGTGGTNDILNITFSNPINFSVSNAINATFWSWEGLGTGLLPTLATTNGSDWIYAPGSIDAQLDLSGGNTAVGTRPGGQVLANSDWGTLTSYNATEITFRVASIDAYTFKVVIPQDTDNDGIVNHLDLDSDNDGCYDSYEAGVTGATNNGSPSDSLAIVTMDTTGVGTNGFANVLETTTEGEYDGTYTYSIAINAAQNKCLDSDGDTVPDYVDLDNDNDGILDSLECSFDPIAVGDVLQEPGVVNFVKTVDETISGSMLGLDVTIGPATLLSGSTGNKMAISSAQITTGLIGFRDFSGYQAGDGISASFTFSQQENFNIKSDFHSSFDSGVNQSDSILLKPINPNTAFSWRIDEQDAATDIEILSDNTLVLQGSDLSGVDLNGPYAVYTIGMEGMADGFVMEFFNTTSYPNDNTNGQPTNWAYFNVSICVDSDGDGIKNYLDLDSDNDNCPDFVEAAGSFETTDGVVSQGTVSAGTGSTVTTNLGVDVNNQGVPLIATSAGQTNTTDVTTAGPDIDFDGIADACDDTDDRPDNDEDGVVDVEDLDDDNDGVLDSEECGTPVDFSGLSLAVGDATETFTSLMGGVNIGSSISVGTFIHTGFTPDSDLEIRASTTGDRIIVEDKTGDDDTEIKFTIIPNGRLTFIGDAASSITSNFDTEVAVTSYNPSPDFEWKIQNIANSNVTINNGGGVSLRGTNFSSSAEFIVTHEGTVDSMVIRYNNYTYSPDFIEIGIAVCPDVDGDGIANHLDLDSDGDGCYDSYEAGVIGATNDGSATDSLAIVTSDTTGVGANGFANALETTTEGAYDGTYTYANAIDNLIATCHNSAPLAIDDISTTQLDVPVIANVLYNDLDFEKDSLIVNTIPMNVMGGTVTIDGLGNYTFTPITGQTGEGSFEYEVCDTATPELCDTATVVITIVDNTDPNNNDVVGVEDNFVTENDAPLTGSLLSNDSDPDGDDLTINTTPVTAPSSGTLVINTDGTFSFTPSANFVGTESFAYEVCDDGTPMTCDTVTVTIEVLLGDGENSLYATDDASTGEAGATQAGNVTDNDNDPESGNLIVTELEGVTNGTLILGTDGSYTYEPNAGYTGNDAFSYQVCDDGTPMACDSATVYVTVLSVNKPPIAKNDINTTEVGSPSTGNVSTNDTDPEGGTLTVSTTPLSETGGTVIIDPTGTYVFTPTPGFVGEGSFEYEICDDGSPVACDTAEVVIQVIDVSDPNNNEVVGVEDNFVTENDAPLTGSLLSNDSDPDGDDLTINTTPVTAPSSGTLVINTDGTFSFTPSANFVGTESFAYEVCDDGTPMTCDMVTVTIEVLAGDGKNSLYATDDASTGEAGATQAGNVTDNDNDPESGNLIVTELEGVTNGTLILGTDGSYTYEPNAGYTGNDAFSYQVCDDGTPMACDSATVYVTVLSVNKPPIAKNDINTTEVGSPSTGNVSTNDTDPEGGTLTVSTTPLSETGGTVIIDPTGTYVFTPTPGFVGEGSFEYEICDDGSPVACDTAEVVIQVIDVSDPNNNDVVGVEDNFVTENDAPLTGSLLSNDSDPDGDDLTINTTPVTAPSSGTLVINTDGTFSFTPSANFVGTESFAYEVCDDGTPMTCDTVTVTIEVLLGDGENSLYATDDASTGEAGATQAGNVTDNDNDPESGNLIVTELEGVTNGTLILGTDGSYTYEPNAGYTGNDAFSYQVCDDGTPMACDSATVYVTVLSVNKPPIAKNDINTTEVGSPSTGNVSTNDTDPEGGTLTVSTTPLSETGGTVIIDPTGTYVFTPTPGFVGEGSFEYEICDDGSPIACDTAEVIIQVIDVSDPNNNEVVGVEDNFVTENDAPLTGSLLSNDSDPDGDDLTINTTPVTAPSSGTLVINTDGTFSFTPSANFVGTESFAYEVCDDGTPMTCDTTAVTIEVLAGNGENSLYATDDASTGNTGFVQIIDVLSNDNDPESGTLTLSMTLLENASNGIVLFNPDGTFSYLPGPEFVGNDVFRYKVCDDGSPEACDSASVYITVLLPVNEPPVAINDINTTEVGSPASGNVSTNDIDPEGGTLIVSTSPLSETGGTVIIDPTGTYVFTPTPGFVGEGSFEYEICDDGSPVACDTAEVVIQVIDVSNPNNNEVVGVEDNFVTENDAPLTGSLLSNDSDPDGDVLTISTTPVSAPTTGSLLINVDGTFSFTPATDFVGEETFEYEVCDDGTPMTCDTVAVIIEVLAGDGENSLYATDDASTGTGDATQTGNVTDNDNDPESNLVTVTVLDDVSNGTLTLGTDGSYSYEPTVGFMGNDAFTYQVCDDGTPMACDSATVHITVLTPNTCGSGSIVYAMTDGIENTTGYQWDNASAPAGDVPSTQMFGLHRSTNYCESGGWRHYYNDNEPDKFLFSVEMGANTTEIEYIEIRVAEFPESRYDTTATNAMFGLSRDWHVKTVDDNPLTEPVNIRFYYVPSELEKMLDDLTALADSDSTATAPTVEDLVWFKKDDFNPETDLTADGLAMTNGLGYTILIPRVAINEDGSSESDDSSFGNGINYVQFNGILGFSGGSVFLQGTGTALPAKLTSFKGRAEDCQIELNWSSATEDNFNFYQIERSRNGRDFSRLFELPGQGNTTTPADYQFVDELPMATNYYRLKMVDLDGRYEYSKVIAVGINCPEHETVLYPNPVVEGEGEGVVNIEFFAPMEEAHIEVIDVIGKKVRVLNLGVAKKEMNTVRIDVSDLASGTYMVRIKGIEGSSKFIIAE